MLAKMKDPEKGFEQDYTGGPRQNVGSRIRNVSAPDVTLRDVAAENSTGAVNPTGRKDNNAWKKAKLDLATTNK